MGEENLLNCVLAKVDVSAFDDEVLLLPNGVELTKTNYIQKPADRSGMADEVTSVTYSAGRGEAIFSYLGDRVMGNIKDENGTDYALEPCNNFPGCHVWKENIDLQSLMKEDRRSSIKAGSSLVASDREKTPVALSEKMKKLVQKGKADDTTVAEISVKFYYTKEFANATSDLKLFFNQVIATTNQGFRNSKIPVKVKLFCIEASNLTDQKEADTLRVMFENLKGKGLKGWKSVLGSADAAALFVMKTNQAGLGELRGWDSYKPFTMNVKQHTFTSYVFGHELGHNFGCEHNFPTTEPKNIYYSYGYGSLINPKYLSIMAYPSGKYEKVINYYSNPKVSYNGVPTGSKTQNCARVIKENRFAFAAVGDESGTCSSMPTTATTTTTTTTATTTTGTIFEGTEGGEGELTGEGEWEDN